MKALLICCAFNEGLKLERTALSIANALKKRNPSAMPVDVLIVDDCSNDGIPEKVCSAYGFKSLRNETRSHVGASILRAYTYGLENQYGILMTIAGNSKDNPEEMDLLINPIVNDKADFVQGSRYLPGGKFGQMPLYRQLATRYLHPLLFNFVTGKKMTDTTNGFRAIRSSLLQDKRINLHQDWLQAYELEPYLLYQTAKLGYRLTEVPVTKIYPEKKLGYSKIPPLKGWWQLIKPLVLLSLGIKK